MPDYMSLEDVLAHLKITESKLRELVAAGKLRSYRDQGEEKFRRPDVMALTEAATSEPTVVLPGAEGADDDDSVIPTIELSVVSSSFRLGF